MKRLSDVALVGTARLPGALPPTGTPADGLVDQVETETPEARALLAAGTEAVYRQAGLTPRTGVALPPAAPAEKLPACSPRAADTLRDVLYDYADLLPEALARLAQAGVRLAPALLPLALDTKRPELREALLPALGERGLWLARFNPEWRWVLSRAAPEDAAERLKVWEEGSAPERLGALRRERAERPDEARGWLESVWKQERAEQRATLLGALSVGLALSDEAFLESALDDRSQAVRAAAADLLSLLPDSALAGRMRARAESLVTFTAPAAEGGLWGAVKTRLSGGTSAGVLSVTPPTSLPRDWERDGLVAKPPQGVGERAHWLAQLLARVPPAHLERHLAATPEQLVRAAVASEWSAALAQGWSAAALHFESEAWAAPLWDFWRGLRAQSTGPQDPTAASFLLELLPLMPAASAEARVLQLLESAQQSVSLERALSVLPAPWDAALAAGYLKLLAARLGGADADWQWSATFAPAARALPPEPMRRAHQQAGTSALPPSAFPRALQLAESCDTTRLPTGWARALEAFQSTLRMRQRLLEEIHP